MSEDKYSIIEKSKKCDDEVVKKHLLGFVDKFVVKAKRKRWESLLLKRKYEKFSKLEQDLNLSLCKKISDSECAALAVDECVFIDLINDPVYLKKKHLIQISHYNEVLCSISPGSLVIYFTHEGDIWLCENK